MKTDSRYSAASATTGFANPFPQNPTHTLETEDRNHHKHDPAVLPHFSNPICTIRRRTTIKTRFRTRHNNSRVVVVEGLHALAFGCIHSTDMHTLSHTPPGHPTRGDRWGMVIIGMQRQIFHPSASGALSLSLSLALDCSREVLPRFVLHHAQALYYHTRVQTAIPTHYFMTFPVHRNRRNHTLVRLCTVRRRKRTPNSRHYFLYITQSRAAMQLGS